MNEFLTRYIENQILLQPQKLYEDLHYDNEKFNFRLEYNSLIEYVNNFLEGNPINRYLILPGIRDVGKTTLMFQVYDYLLNEKLINSENILYVSCDEIKRISNDDLIDVINNYLDMFHNENIKTVSEPIFLLIDEAQYDNDWSLTGKLIYDNNKNIFMIFSGSSALNLSFDANSARRLLRIPISPLNYSQHLKLKYGYFEDDISKRIENIILTGNIENSDEIKRKILKLYINFKNYDVNEWKKYLLFGGFPSYSYLKPKEITNKITSMVNKVITYDLKKIEGITDDTLETAFQILNFFSLQDPGEVSKESLSNIYDTNIKTLSKILNLLEKSQLLFSVEPFTSSAKRTTKPNKYYFATPSLKHNLSLKCGLASAEGENAYMGKLLENYVASSFFNRNYNISTPYHVFYDAKGKGEKNVDFVIQKGLNQPIPIEVSWGKKDKSQIKRGISKYKAPYGIIISSTTDNIMKKDNVIYMPHEIFALM